MRRKLTDLQLKNARELFATGQFTKTELAREFGVSITTMCLWLSDDQTIKKNLKKKKRIARTHCEKCHVHYSKHPRCFRCESLLCGGNGVCGWCVNDMTTLIAKKYFENK